MEEYKLKQKSVKAVRYHDGLNIDEISIHRGCGARQCPVCQGDSPDKVFRTIKKGLHDHYYVDEGDWIVWNENGEISVMGNNSFHMKYEKANIPIDQNKIEVNEKLIDDIIDGKFDILAHFSYPTGTVSPHIYNSNDRVSDLGITIDEEKRKKLHERIDSAFELAARNLKTHVDNKVALKLLMHHNDRIVYLSWYDLRYAVCDSINTNRGGVERQIQL